MADVKYHRRRRSHRRFATKPAELELELRVLELTPAEAQLRPSIAASSWKPFGRPPP